MVAANKKSSSIHFEKCQANFEKVANSKIHLANNTLDFSVLLNNHYELNVVFIRVVKP